MGAVHRSDTYNRRDWQAYPKLETWVRILLTLRWERESISRSSVVVLPVRCHRVLHPLLGCRSWTAPPEYTGANGEKIRELGFQDSDTRISGAAARKPG